MSRADTEYLATLETILKKGNKRGDRTGTGTISLFGLQMRFDLSQGFPLLTTKEVHFKSVMVELLFFLQGLMTIDFLQENNVKIWNEWAVPLSDIFRHLGISEDEISIDDKQRKSIGPMYPTQWRKWQSNQYVVSNNEMQITNSTIDQIKNLIDGLKNNPNSRRHLVSTWNVAHLPNESVSPQQNVIDGQMALAPCHYAFQCYVDDGKLSMLVNQRSADNLYVKLVF